MSVQDVDTTSRIFLGHRGPEAAMACLPCDVVLLCILRKPLSSEVHMSGQGIIRVDSSSTIWFSFGLTSHYAFLPKEYQLEKRGTRHRRPTRASDPCTRQGAVLCFGVTRANDGCNSEPGVAKMPELCRRARPRPANTARGHRSDFPFFRRLMLMLNSRASGTSLYFSCCWIS